MAIKIPKGNQDLGTIRLGGLFAPGYIESYAAAWRELLPKAREVAIPILFLQRHTLELIVKDVIHDLLITREEIRLGHEVFGLPAILDVIDQDTWSTQWKRLHREHEFDPLFDDLTTNLKLLDLPQLPSEYQTAKDLVHSVDDGAGTRFRYDTDRTRRRSFGITERPIAPIAELASILETIISVHSRVSERGADPVSFLDQIYQHWVGVNYDVGAAVHQLEERTRNDQVVWTRAKAPQVESGRNSDYDSIGPFHDTCLTTENEGRQMVIFSRLAVDDRMPDYLACYDDGNLSRLLWPPEYQSNLWFAAIDSVKRHASQQ
jgi:hypothetical protein